MAVANIQDRCLLLLFAACNMAEAVYWQMVSDPSQYPQHRRDWESIYKGDENGKWKITCRYQPGDTMRGGHVWERRCEVPDFGRKTTNYPFEVLGYEPTTENLYWQERIDGDIIATKGIQLTRGLYNYVCAIFTYGQGNVNSQDDPRRMKCYAAGVKDEQDVCEFGFPCAQALLNDPAIFYEVSDVKFDMDDIEEIESFSQAGATVEYTNEGESSETIVMTPRLALTEESSYEMDQYYYDGTDMQVTTGVPAYIDGQWERSAQKTQTLKYGEPAVSTVEHGSDMEVEEARSTCSVRMVGLQKKISLRYTAHVNNTFPDGHQVEGEVSGVYRGLPVDKVKMEVIQCLNMDSGEMSTPQFSILSAF